MEAEADVGLASPVELLREKSFSRCSREELSQLAELMSRIDLAVPRRRTRRREPSRAGRPTSGDDPPLVPHRRRAARARLAPPAEAVSAAILLLDVSGSMDAYSRALVMFAHAALRSDRRWEAFCFGTRLTRITRQLEGPDAGRGALAPRPKWSTGTAARASASPSSASSTSTATAASHAVVVVICSDGLEVGDPDLLAEQMARLSRLAYRVVWLNPLKEDPAYEPLARGMRAALPHVDHFWSGHSLASLEDVAAALSRW